MWDLHANAGAEVDRRVPEGHTALLVVQSGTARVNGEPMQPVELAAFDRRGDAVRLQAESAFRALVLIGEPLGEPIVGQGPFVMNTREQIRQAVQDYQAGRMGHLA